MDDSEMDSEIDDSEIDDSELDDSELDGVDANLREHIEAQLVSERPIFISGDTALHRAVKEGLGRRVVARLLAACPFLIYATTDEEEETALHLAAEGGAAAIVTQLLAADPPIEIEARRADGRTALHLAAHAGHHEIVTQLVAANPALMDAREYDGRTALHCCAKPSLLEAIIKGEDSWTALQIMVKLDHEEAVAQLLTVHPELIHNTTQHGRLNVFHQAAICGSNKVMPRLLATVPRPVLEQLLLRTTNDDLGNHSGETALHMASRKGNSNSNMVAQLLAACPALVDVLDRKGQTCLHSAVCRAKFDSTPTVEVLLAFKPALIHAVDAQGNTILHSICQTYASYKKLIEKVWKLNPEALRVVNRDGNTPFHLAVKHRNDSAVDLLQWSLTIDEIMSAHTKCIVSYARFKHLLRLQCKELAQMKLLPDVMDIVYAYVGFSKWPF